MFRVALRLSLLTLLVVLAAHPKAEAGCFTPHAVTTTYYGYIDDSPGFEGTLWSCQPIIISPMHANHWGVIGETVRDCDGNVSSWGDTTSCTGTGNVERTSESCPPICD